MIYDTESADSNESSDIVERHHHVVTSTIVDVAELGDHAG